MCGFTETFVCTELQNGEKALHKRIHAGCVSSLVVLVVGNLVVD